jgi:type IV pilus assembly protein PilB
MSESGERLLGDVLVKAGLINESQLKMAMETLKQVPPGSKLAAVLVKLRYVQEDRLATVLGQHLNLPVLGLKDLVVSPRVSSLIDLEVLEKKTILPVRRTEDTLLVAVADPMDYSALDEVRFLTGLRTETAVATRSNIQKAIDYYFHGRSCKELQDAEAAVRGESGKAAGAAGGAVKASPTIVLQALVELLITKKVVTREELMDFVNRSK